MVVFVFVTLLYFSIDEPLTYNASNDKGLVVSEWQIVRKKKILNIPIEHEACSIQVFCYRTTFLLLRIGG